MYSKEWDAAMKKVMVFLVIFSWVSVLGCGATSKESKAKSISERSDVFQEITDDGTLLNGFCELEIVSHIKTTTEGYYPMESKKSYHGKPTYPFMLNIDGQSILWDVPGKLENTPLCDDKGLKTPEGGNGMWYSLQKTIRLHCSRHRVIFALSGDGISKESDILLQEGKSYVLEFNPIYNSYMGKCYWLEHGYKAQYYYNKDMYMPNYSEGIRDLEVILRERP